MENDLPLEERILGDKGYVGEPRIITPRKKMPGRDLSEDEQAFNALINCTRIIVENCFAMVKTFRAMSKTSFRPPRTTTPCTTSHLS